MGDKLRKDSVFSLNFDIGKENKKILFGSKPVYRVVFLYIKNKIFKIKKCILPIKNLFNIKTPYLAKAIL